MTKVSHNWKGKELEHFIILRKLSDQSKLGRTDFEYPRKKVRDSKFDDILEPRDQERIPHASLIKRLDELLKDGSIQEIKTKDRSKKGLPIRRYKITFFGFIKLLGLSSDKGFLSDVMKNVKLYFFLLSDEFNFLIPTFSEHQLFDTITAVCKDTTIEIDLEAKNRRKKKSTKISSIGIPSTILLKNVKWAHQYYIEIKVHLLESTYLLKRSITISGIKKDESKEDVKPFLMISGLINSAFFYELLMRCKRQGSKFSGYPHGKEIITTIIERLKGNMILRPSYLEFLRHIESKHNAEGQVMKQFISSLSSKRSPKVTDPWQIDMHDAYNKSLRF